MTRAHPVLEVQNNLDALIAGNAPDFALYGATTPGRNEVLSDIRLLALWVMSAVEQRHFDGHLPTDFASALTSHRQSTLWPHGPYWRSARAVPSALDTAAGLTVALSVLCLPDTTVAATVLHGLMQNANIASPYQRPISRRADLTTTLRSVLDVAYARDNADRRLQSRLARKLAIPRPAPQSPLMWR